MSKHVGIHLSPAFTIIPRLYSWSLSAQEENKDKMCLFCRKSRVLIMCDEPLFQSLVCFFCIPGNVWSSGISVHLWGSVLVWITREEVRTKGGSVQKKKIQMWPLAIWKVTYCMSIKTGVPLRRSDIWLWFTLAHCCIQFHTGIYNNSVFACTVDSFTFLCVKVLSNQDAVYKSK